MLLEKRIYKVFLTTYMCTRSESTTRIWVSYRHTHSTIQPFLFTHTHAHTHARAHTHTHASLEPRLSVPDFVSQLWRKIVFSKAARQNPERRAWVRGYTRAHTHTCTHTQIHTSHSYSTLPTVTWSHTRM